MDQVANCLRKFREGRGRVPLSDSEFVGRFQSGAATAADDGGAVAAGEGIGHFFGAVGAVERGGLRVRLRWVWRACRHEEENCTIEAALALQFGVRRLL